MSGFIQWQALMMRAQLDAIIRAQTGAVPIPPPVQNTALLELHERAYRQARTHADWAAGIRPWPPRIPYPSVAPPRSDWRWPP